MTEDNDIFTPTNNMDLVRQTSSRNAKALCNELSREYQFEGRFHTGGQRDILNDTDAVNESCFHRY